MNKSFEDFVVEELEIVFGRPPKLDVNTAVPWGVVQRAAAKWYQQLAEKTG